MEKSEKFYNRFSQASFLVCVGGMFVGGVELGISTLQQAQYEYPLSITYAQYRSGQQFIKEMNETIIQLADDGSYAEIPRVAQDPERLASKIRVSNYEQLELKRKARHQELVKERFSFHPRTVLATLITATGFAMSMIGIYRRPRTTL